MPIPMVRNGNQKVIPRDIPAYFLPMTGNRNAFPDSFTNRDVKIHPDAIPIAAPPSTSFVQCSSDSTRLYPTKAAARNAGIPYHEP